MPLTADEKKHISTIKEKVISTAISSGLSLEGTQRIILIAAIDEHLDTKKPYRTTDARHALRSQRIAALHTLVSDDAFALAQLPDDIKAVLPTDGVGSEEDRSKAKGTAGGGARRIRDARGL